MAKVTNKPRIHSVAKELDINNKELIEILEKYLKTGEYSKVIKQAVLEVTGKTYKLAVYNNKQEATPKNPLSDLVSKAKNLGVKIEEE